MGVSRQNFFEQELGEKEQQRLLHSASLTNGKTALESIKIRSAKCICFTVLEVSVRDEWKSVSPGIFLCIVGTAVILLHAGSLVQNLDLHQQSNAIREENGATADRSEGV